MRAGYSLAAVTVPFLASEYHPGTLDRETLLCPLRSLPSHIIGEGQPLIPWGCLTLPAVALPAAGTACCGSPPCQGTVLYPGRQTADGSSLGKDGLVNCVALWGLNSLYVVLVFYPFPPSNRVKVW